VDRDDFINTILKIGLPVIQKRITLDPEVKRLMVERYEALGINVSEFVSAALRGECAQNRNRQTA
jgi:hypothetical protein